MSVDYDPLDRYQVFINSPLYPDGGRDTYTGAEVGYNVGGGDDGDSYLSPQQLLPLLPQLAPRWAAVDDDMEGVARGIALDQAATRARLLANLGRPITDPAGMQVGFTLQRRPWA